MHIFLHPLNIFNQDYQQPKISHPDLQQVVQLFFMRPLTRLLQSYNLGSYTSLSGEPDMAGIPQLPKSFTGLPAVCLNSWSTSRQRLQIYPSSSKTDKRIHRMRTTLFFRRLQSMKDYFRSKSHDLVSKVFSFWVQLRVRVVPGALQDS